jgi:hypothetical protein
MGDNYLSRTRVASMREMVLRNRPKFIGFIELTLLFWPSASLARPDDGGQTLGQGRDRAPHLAIAERGPEVAQSDRLGLRDDSVVEHGAEGRNRSFARRLNRCTVEQARSLSVAFEEEKVNLARQKLDALDKEYERWVLAKASAENERERSLARTRCQELEQQLTLWEFRSTPLENQLAELRSKVRAFFGDRAALPSGQAGEAGPAGVRAGADGVQKLLSRT